MWLLALPGHRALMVFYYQSLTVFEYFMSRDKYQDSMQYQISLLNGKMYCIVKDKLTLPMLSLLSSKNF